MTSFVEQQIRARIAAAAARRRRRRAQRREFAEARERGLKARHAAKLRHLAEREEQP